MGHLVLVGGGHAHMTTLKQTGAFVAAGHRVTLIGPGPFHYYSGMGPGLLAGTYRPEEVRFNVRRMVEEGGGTFVPGKVERIDSPQRFLVLDTGEKIEYDVVSFNVGSRVPIGSLRGSGDNLWTVKPIENLLEARERLETLLRQGEVRLLVAGGGPAALELTGNLWRRVFDLGGRARITLLGGRRFLGRLPDKVRRLAVDSLRSRGIRIVEGAYMEGIGQGVARLANGESHPFDMGFLALGVQPPELFRQSGLPIGPDGGLLVNPFLQSVAHPEMFGGGDCICFRDRPLDKVGVYAVRQNPVLCENLLAALDGRPLKPFEPAEGYLLIFNLGNGRGIFWKDTWVWSGRAAFQLKNYIDRRFMRRFQVSGERG